MKRDWINGSIFRVVARGLLAAASLTLLAGPLAARAAEGELPKEIKACLECHAKPDLKKKMEDGESLSLSISQTKYAQSMHKEVECSDCHKNIEGDAHAKSKAPIKSQREYAQGVEKSCRSCHKKIVGEYNDSVHASLVKGGDAGAPICSDCHQVHSLLSKEIERYASANPCLGCHKKIGKAWQANVHGKVRAEKGRLAPTCIDCHKTHAIKAAAESPIKAACLACHKDALEQHKAWLPKADRHFETISCPVCHAPNAERRVNLMLYSNAGKEKIGEAAGVPIFERRVESAEGKGGDLNDRALLALLKDLGQSSSNGAVFLRGRLEVKSGIDAHSMADKSQAMHDCKLCHQEGAEAFQSVTLTVAGPDGRPLRHDVDKDVLTSVQATQSVRGFYTLGATRVKFLDVLLVLVVGGALAGALTHAGLRLATRRMRAKLESERTSTTEHGS